MATMLTDIGEAELVSKAQQGDLEAFNEIVLRYRAGVINIVYRMCGDPEVAEDAAQTAFVRVWQRLDDYRPHSTFRSWLYRIAVNAALDILRREKRLLPLDTRQENTTDQDPSALVERRERHEQVHQAILALPAASRTVLVLREYEGFSYKEIAQTLDIPVGTVMSRLNYARNRLVETLSPIMKTMEPQNELA